MIDDIKHSEELSNKLFASRSREYLQASNQSIEINLLDSKLVVASEIAQIVFEFILNTWLVLYQ